jgi:transcriptional regulator with XRE-family HTH domain
MSKTIYSTEYQSFLRILRQVREEAELSQQELARRLGRTQSFVSKCERGERRIDVVELRHFCRAMKMSLGDFVKRLEGKITNVAPANQQ